MGSDLQLTGLASGFDWKPVVEQLVELEAIPKQRLQSEKSANESKVSDLGLLKSQLDALNGAAGALNNDDLYEGRKVGMDSVSAAILSASAKAGALTGDYVVSVYSIGTQTEMSSKNRVPGGLGAGLTLSEKLNELPLQTAITTGTFTIAGKTLSIDNLDVTLQSIIDEINAAVSGVSGVNPESDMTGITFEYDQANDKMIVDGGELSPNSLNAVPVLGSPTDSSNFLHVLRLLNRASVTRDADLEVGSGISVWSGGDGTQSWLRLDDPDESLSSSDSRLYVAKGAAGSEVLFKRIANEALHNAATDYTAGTNVYKNGFVYQVKSGVNFPTTAFDDNNPKVTAGDMTKEATGPHWKLLSTLSSHSDYSTTGTNFGADADNANTTINHDPGDTSKTYKTGDIVKGSDGNFFRAVKERLDTATVNWDDLSTDFAGANGIATTATANGSEWTNNIPKKIRINGRMYQHNGAGYSAVEHSGNGVGNTLYGAAFDTTGKKYVVGKQGDANVQDHYYKPNQTKWDTVQAHAGTSNRSNWAANDYVQIGSKFYQATSQWDPTNAASPAANELFSLDTTSAASYGKLWVPNSYIQDTSGAGTNFFKASAAWSGVGDHTGASTVQSWAKDKVVHNSAGGADKKFYQANANFSAIQAHNAGTLFQTFNSGTIGASNANVQAMLVEDGTSNNFYKAGANWGETVAHTAGNAVTAFDTTGSAANNKFAKIGSVLYEAKQDFSSITAASYDKSVNHTTGTVVYDGTDYFQASANVADHVSASGSAVFADASGATTSTRFLHQNAASSKVWKPTSTLTSLAAHSSNPTGKYSQNNVVKGASNYFKASANWGNVTDHNSGGDVSSFGNGKVVHNDGNNTFYQSQGDLSGITNWSDSAYTNGSSFSDTIRDGSGSGYYTPKFDIANSFTNTSAFSATDVVKEGANYFQFQVAYTGNYAAGVASNAIALGTDGNYYQNTSGGANSNDPASGGAGWSAGFATLDAMQTGLGTGVLKKYTTTNPADATARADLWEDVTAAVNLSNTGHAQLSTYWQDATAIVATGTAYWTVDTDPLTLSSANSYWTEDTQATTPATGGSGVWTNVTNLAKLADTTGTAGAGNGLWAVVDASTLAANANWWGDVTTDISNPTATNDFWTDKTTDIFDFADIGNGNDVDTYWGSSNVNAELTDDSNGGFSSWWTDKTTKLTDLNLVATDAETQQFWSSKTAELTNSGDAGFASHWTEYGHADTASSFDSNYWQQIKPGMKRIGNTGAVANAIDYSLWAKAGNVAGYAGSDGNFGTRDSGEDAFGRSGAHDFSTTFAGTLAGEIRKGSDGKYYRARANTSTDPIQAANANDWDLVAVDLTKANNHVHTDSDFWQAVTIPDPDAVSAYWEQLQESVIESSQALGTIDMKVSLAGANFGTTLVPNASGLGNFFIGEGEGAVRIDYNVNTDTVSTLVDRVNSSDANVHMYYDPVSDRFVVRNKEAGSVGITLHESTTWDALTANSGTGNLLNAMGLAAPAANYVDYNSANNATYANGTYVSLGGTGGDPTTFWQALQVPTESPSTASTQWRQVIASVGRTMVDELGQNSIVRVNEGDKVYSNKTSFTDSEHGYEGITFDIAQMDVNDSASFVVARDSSQAKAAIDKLIEEFNDAQDYIKSLTSVTNDGERVTSGKFSSNIEISRLGSQLRKVVFGDSTPHSESGATSDGSNLIINARAGNSAELVAIANDLNFDSNNDGYIVKVLNDNASGNPKYWTYSAAGGGGAANWTETDPAYSSFRLSSIGLDFGIGSDRIMVKNSALLIQELEKNPDKVKALFSDARVESTKTADADDIAATAPKTLTNNDPNSPTATNAVVGDTIANSAAFDANTSTYRPYQGISNAIDEFISAFLSGDSDSGYKGAYNTHIESIRSQNKRIDERIEDMERYLEQREKTLSDGFMRMEEMQSQLNTQLQTLQNSFKK